jgi:uncharacterized protein DUF4157
MNYTAVQRAARTSTDPSPGGVMLQRKCACETSGTSCARCASDKRGLQRKATYEGSSLNVVPPIVNDVLTSPGQPLDATTRSIMEEQFGHDFSGVRVHTNAHAATSARSVGALAYTVGNDMAFDTGQYAPHTTNGRDLLAHELAHVVQQSSASSPNTLSESQLEHEADAAAQRVSAGQIAPKLGATEVGLARKPKPRVSSVAQMVTLRHQPGQVTVFYDGSPVATINYKAQAGQAETSSSQGKDGNEWIVVVTPADSDATYSVTPQYTQLYEAGRLALSDIPSDYDFEKGEEYGGRTFRISAKAEQNAAPPSAPHPKAPIPQVKSPVSAQPEKKLEKPQAKSPDQLIDESSTLKFLDEEKLGNELLKYALAGDTTTVDVTLDEIDSIDRDDVALGFVSHATSEQLAKLAETEQGRKLLLRLYDELTSGYLGNDEKEQAERLMQARTQRIDPNKLIEPDKKAMVIPFSSIGFTKLSSASLTVKRLHNGKIWVKSHMKVEHWKDARNLPTKDFALGLDGVELDPDDIVGLYLYDEGGKVVHVPAIYLLQLGNQEDTKAYSMMGEAVFTGLTLGIGGGAAAGGKIGTKAWAARILSSEGGTVAAEGASTGVWTARGLTTLKWADRGAAAFGAASMLINDHRGLILQHFPEEGKEFLGYWQKVETVLAIYGLARGAVALGQTAVALRTSIKNIRARKAQLKGLSAVDEATLDDTIRQTEKTLDDLENAEKNAPKTGSESVNAELKLKEPPMGEPGHREAPVDGGHKIIEVPDPNLPSGIGCELHSSPPFPRVPCPIGMGETIGTIKNFNEPLTRFERKLTPEQLRQTHITQEQVAAQKQFSTESKQADMSNLKSVTKKQAAVGIGEKHHIGSLYDTDTEELFVAAGMSRNDKSNIIKNFEEHGQMRGYVEWEEAKIVDGKFVKPQYKPMMKGHHPEYKEWVNKHLRDAVPEGITQEEKKKRLTAVLEKLRQIIEEHPYVLTYGYKSLPKHLW